MIVVVSGLSGAGKSTALHALEDLGLFCTDNLPLEMLPEWSEQMRRCDRQAAVGIDIRSAERSQLISALRDALDVYPEWHLIYVEASPEVLLRRYSTVRRRHPADPELELPRAIEAERELLQPLRAEADLVLDSSQLNPYELAEQVERYWRGQQRSGEFATLFSLTSFSYQRGIPADADLVIDMRFLPNPHYQPGMAQQTGRDEPVRQYLMAQPEAREAEERLCGWLDFVWPQLRRERKRYLTMAIGCSGGRHRSVFMVEQLAAHIRRRYAIEPLVRHRELER